ncbi:HEAT repeat-containing protein [Rivularia sp. PCC 7116]|nr:HEAT repeat-containing protein [Rivularia sp. PCC 7116]
MAIAVFGEYVDKSQITILIKLLKDKNIHIRCKAISALGEIADDSLLEIIIEALNDEDHQVRGITVKALGRIGGKLAEELIIHAFLDQNDFVSKKVFETLLKIDKNKAIQLIFLASQCYDAEVRRKAALFLGRIVNKANYVSDLPLLINLLNDVNSKVRKTAVEELMMLKYGMESPEFKALREEYNKFYCKAEIDIEKIINESDLSTLLLKSVGHDYHGRKAANKAIDIEIAKAGNVEDTKESFITALQHENPNIRCGAANYIGKIGGKSVIPNLLEALQDEEPKVRSRTIVSLISIADKSIIIPALLKLLKDENYRVRSLAAYELGNIADDSTAIPSVSFANALIETLQDKAIDVRRSAICALNKIDSEQAAEVISASLPYKDNFIDNIAASILSKHGKLEYITHLWKALVQAKYINQAKEINFHSATDNLYSTIEKIQQQHQIYNPKFC